MVITTSILMDSYHLNSHTMAQSAINFMGSNMSLPNTNCPGVASNVVWNVLRIAYAAAMSLERL
jgi:hypothetical protein